MWARTLALSFSSMVILATSFCVQKRHVRDVSSHHLPDISKKIKPLDFTTKTGHQFRYFEDPNFKYEDETVTIVQTFFICEGTSKPQLGEHFAVEAVTGKSISDKDPNKIGLRGDKFFITYLPLDKHLDFGVDGEKPTPAEVESSGEKKMTFHLDDLDNVCRD